MNLLNYTPHVAILLIAAMAADLTAVMSRQYMMPMPMVSSKKNILELAKPYKPLSSYDDILARNIFNSDGIIPDIQVASDSSGADISGTARESDLPLGLIGTIVHANPGKSVATLEFKNTSDKVIPYIPNDEIEGMATLIKIERKRVYIRNLSSGALEYIQIKDDTGGFSFSKKGSPAAKQDSPIMEEGENTFGITRSDLETQMANLPELLTQARGVPNIVGGRINGFKITEIVPNSLFAKLGVKDGDVLKEVDGEKLDSPAKAMELYNSLRTKNKINISGERNGKPFTMTYNIR
ncbi:MAG: general secretion pathway protein GspC [Oligoflexia bacterium]|nr:general secretion pathway protein GspC [Oligoflexia bacterium]